MRAILDGLYRGSGILAAVFLVAICGAVLLQVGANVIDWVIARIAGQPLGLMIPSYAEFTGFFLSASSFLALAYTLGHGGHIRVSLVISRIKGRARRGVELTICLLGILLSGYFAYYAVDLTYDSWRFNDLSSGIVPAPLWLPQGAMAVGLLVLTVALIDEAVRVLKGGMPLYVAGDDAEIPKDLAQPGALSGDGAPDKAFAE